MGGVSVTRMAFRVPHSAHSLPHSVLLRADSAPGTLRHKLTPPLPQGRPGKTDDKPGDGQDNAGRWDTEEGAGRRAWPGQAKQGWWREVARGPGVGGSGQSPARCSDVGTRLSGAGPGVRRLTGGPAHTALWPRPATAPSLPLATDTQLVSSTWGAGPGLRGTSPGAANRAAQGQRRRGAGSRGPAAGGPTVVGGEGGARWAPAGSGAVKAAPSHAPSIPGASGAARWPRAPTNPALGKGTHRGVRARGAPWSGENQGPGCTLRDSSSLSICREKLSLCSRSVRSREASAAASSSCTSSCNTGAAAQGRGRVPGDTNPPTPGDSGRANEVPESLSLLPHSRTSSRVKD